VTGDDSSPDESAGWDGNLDRLYRTEQPRLLRFLAYHGAQPADAADAAQHAWVEVCRRRDRVARMELPGAYLRKIALNEWRRLAARPGKDQERAVERGWINLAAVEDVYGKDDVRAVLEGLAALPDRQRQVMAWRYDGYSPEEIAELLDMNVSTVRSNIRHAKAKLREVLGLGGEEG
jgi:RNA polymerase sigma factor (sigma-70 family)